jgi:hypothetical protein
MSNIHRCAWAIGLAVGMLCSNTLAQPKPAPVADAPTAKTPEAAPPAEAKPAEAKAAPGSEPPSSTPAAPPATPEPAASVSPFRAVGEKAASLPEPPPRKDRSLFEMSQADSGPKRDVPRDEPEAPPATLDNLGNFQSHWLMFAHFRGSWVSDRNLDPFSDEDFLPAAGVGGGRVLFSEGQLSLAASAYLEVGGTDSTVRGEASELSLARVAAVPELRYHFIPRSYAFVRAAPALLHAEATLDDAITASTLEDQQFAFAMDVGAGAAINIVGQASGEGHRPRLWVVLEGGYGFAFLRDLELNPKEGDPAPARVEPLRWEAPSLNAPIMRLSLALTL